MADDTPSERLIESAKHERERLEQLIAVSQQIIERSREAIARLDEALARSQKR
jgi:hypothetical protein